VQTHITSRRESPRRAAIARALLRPWDAPLHAGRWARESRESSPPSVLRSGIAVFQRLELTEVGGWPASKPGPIGQMGATGRSPAAAPSPGSVPAPTSSSSNQALAPAAGCGRARPWQGRQDAAMRRTWPLNGGEVLSARDCYRRCSASQQEQPGQPWLPGAREEQNRPGHQGRQADALEAHGFCRRLFVR